MQLLALAIIGLVTLVLVRYQRRGRRVKAIRAARAAIAGPSPIRALRDDERGFVELLACARDDERQLHDLGFTTLGELAIERVDRGVTSVLRALVDGAGTSCAYLVVSTARADRARLVLESYTAEEEILTVRDDQARLAHPPGSYQQHGPDGASIAQLVAQHRAFGPDRGGARPFIRVATIADAHRELDRMYDLVARWREAQPSDALLDADLRGLLGPLYPRYGRAYARRLASSLPSAVVNRR